MKYLLYCCVIFCLTITNSIKIVYSFDRVTAQRYMSEYWGPGSNNFNNYNFQNYAGRGGDCANFEREA